MSIHILCNDNERTIAKSLLCYHISYVAISILAEKKVLNNE